jgi:hypothetical protein
MPFVIDKKLLVYLIITFILMTVIGTLSHEMGHYLVAKYLGYNPTINYASTTMHSGDGDKVIFASHNFWITWGGPFITMFAGTMGFILLFIFCQSYYSTDRLEFKHWTLIFLALFWLRQPTVFCLWLANKVFNAKVISRTDEIRIARNLQLPEWLILVLSAIIGASVLLIVIFRFIPVAQRFTFVVAGLVGGIAGYLLWMYVAGPVLLPG